MLVYQRVSHIKSMFETTSSVFNPVKPWEFVNRNPHKGSIPPYQTPPEIEKNLAMFDSYPIIICS
jgi:hypothetical protein